MKAIITAIIVLGILGLAGICMGEPVSMSIGFGGVSLMLAVGSQL